MENKWIRGAIPALLLHCSIGTVYCWSLFAQDIADKMTNGDKGPVEWAFSFAIFFLGMSAAFAGDIVERNIKLSSRISTVCFSLGLVLTGISIQQGWLIGIYLSYGCLMGIGLGIGYLSPVKTLMLWFKEQKGLATGIAVAGFGLAKVIASPIINALRNAGLEVHQVFYVLAAIYAVLMCIGSLLLKKPEGWVEPHEKSNFKALSMFKEPVFLGIWIMVYINITCGLALISQEKAIMSAIGMSSAAIATMASITAVFNAGGRLGYSAIADKCKDRNTIYKLLFVLSIATTVLTLATGAINSSIVPIVLVLLCVINSTYGGGFSNLPTLLSDRFGMKNVSKIHGLALTAWAMAGLTGNQISAFVVDKTGSYNNVLWVILVMYIISLIVSFTMIKKECKEI